MLVSFSFFSLLLFLTGGMTLVSPTTSSSRAADHLLNAIEINVVAVRLVFSFKFVVYCQSLNEGLQFFR